jgi:tRNA pseudouridine55 synthase
MTSAVKVDGERLYKKAHRGEVVETPVKEVEISAIEVLSFDDEAQTMRCRIACSKGPTCQLP